MIAKMVWSWRQLKLLDRRSEATAQLHTVKYSPLFCLPREIYCGEPLIINLPAFLPTSQIFTARGLFLPVFESLLILQFRRNLSAVQTPNVPYGGVITILTNVMCSLATYTHGTALEFGRTLWTPFLTYNCEHISCPLFFYKFINFTEII